MSHHTACCMHESSRCIHSRPFVALCSFCMYQLLRFTGLEAAPNRPVQYNCLHDMYWLLQLSIIWLQMQYTHARQTALTGLSSSSCNWQAYHFQMWPHKQPAPQQGPLQSLRANIHRLVTVMTDMTEISPPVCLTHHTLASVHEGHH